MSKRIAIIGGGVIGEALLKSVLRSGHPSEALAVAETSEDRAVELRARYGVSVCGNHDVVQDADVVFLAVKPQDIAGVLDQLAGLLATGSVVVSVAAGIRISQVEGALAQGAAVIRVMPNTPATVDEGMFVMSPGTSCSDEQIDYVRELLQTAGQVEVIGEDAQDVVTGVSGSGPAYVFYLAEAMISGGRDAGLSEDVARRLAIQTVLGSAKLLAEPGADPAELRRKVASPGGTTAAAIDVFDERQMRDIIVDGVKAAAARSTELSAI